MQKEFKIKNLEQAAQRIRRALDNRERIIIYGDSDMDGASSVFILKKTLEALCADYKRKDLCAVYFPDREKEGYGLNLKALEFLSDFSPALIITLDCGIGNVNEIVQAKKQGFDVIVIDHHRVLPEMPDALIVDVHQPGDDYPFKEFANAGITLRLAQLFLSDKELLAEFCVMAALASIADMVKETGENKEIIDKGLSMLMETSNKALRFLISAQGFKKQDRQELLQKIIVPLNSAGNADHLNEAYNLICEQDDGKISKIIKSLINNNEEKQKSKKRVLGEITARIGEKTALEYIFEGSKDWQLITLGSIATELAQKYDKPVFLYAIGETESVGSVRVPKNMNGVEILLHCRHLFITYGGHPPASGFRIKNDNIEKFNECLKDYFLRK